MNNLFNEDGLIPPPDQLENNHTEKTGEIPFPEFAEGYSDSHSEEVQEIISAVPSWILKWGITTVLLFYSELF